MLLVTTADESTWKSNHQILFSGEWCRFFSKRDKWMVLDAKILPYHWDDREKYNSDFNYLDKIYENRLKQLSECLGKLHETTCDIRYWRIIIGPWLRFFIDAVFDRYEIIRTAAETNEINDTLVHTYQLDDWIPIDFQDFYFQFCTDPWNHIIFSECILALGLPNTKLNSIIVPKENVESRNGIFQCLKKLMLRGYGFLLPSLFNRVSIIAAYMPPGKLRKLQQSLGQLPYINYPPIRINTKKANHTKRAELFLTQVKVPFELLLNKLICAQIPYAYVENFDSLQVQSLKIFPTHPKLIFTANAYQADDGFKVWVANHVKNKVPFVIEQHGGHFGIGLINQTEDHQLKIADFFASWGWKSKEHSNIIPLPALKLNSETKCYNRNGDILLPVASYPRYFYCHFSVAVAGQVVEYINQQIVFMKMLDPHLLASLRIRIETDKFGWGLHERFKEAGLGWAIDKVQTNLTNRMKDCRIVVSTYNATIFLETLAANFPTIVFFDPNLYEIRPQAKPMMDSLYKVGILHNTPESAAQFLNKINNNIESWWYEAGLQEVRLMFCSVYARTSAEWYKEWASFLKSVTNSR